VNDVPGIVQALGNSGTGPITVETVAFPDFAWWITGMKAAGSRRSAVVGGTSVDTSPHW
jgi:hypothetical protein